MRTARMCEYIVVALGVRSSFKRHTDCRFVFVQVQQSIDNTLFTARTIGLRLFSNPYAL